MNTQNNQKVQEIINAIQKLTFKEFLERFCQFMEDKTRFVLLMCYIRFCPFVGIEEEIPRQLLENLNLGQEYRNERTPIVQQKLSREMFTPSAELICDKFQIWIEGQYPYLLQDVRYIQPICGSAHKVKDLLTYDMGLTPIMLWIKSNSKQESFHANRNCLDCLYQHVLSARIQRENQQFQHLDTNTNVSISTNTSTDTSTNTNVSTSVKSVKSINLSKDDFYFPQELLYPKWQTTSSGPGKYKSEKYEHKALHFWIMYQQEKAIPQQLFYSRCKTFRQNHLNETPLHMWIQYRPGEAIPEMLKYDGWQKEERKDVLTPLMYWIKYRPTETIPDDMFYDDYNTYVITQQNKYRSTIHYTPLLMWANEHPDKPIPQQLIFPECGKSRFYENASCLLHIWLESMLSWIKTRLEQNIYKSEFNKFIPPQNITIPEELKFPGWERSLDAQGRTPIAIWVHYHMPQLYPHPPQELLYEGCQDQVFDGNHTLLSYWFSNYRKEQKRSFEIPEYVLPQKPVSVAVKRQWFDSWIGQLSFETQPECPDILLDPRILQEGQILDYVPSSVRRYIRDHPEDKKYQYVRVFQQWCFTHASYDNVFPDKLRKFVDDNLDYSTPAKQKSKRKNVKKTVSKKQEYDSYTCSEDDTEDDSDERS